MTIGDYELLETIESRHEVVQSRGGSKVKAASELHLWFPRGVSRWLCNSMLNCEADC